MNILLSAVIAICVVFMFFNWVGLFDAIMRKKGFAFAPPLLCGLVSAIVLLIWPGHSLQSWAWVPLIMDPSIGFLCLVFAWQGIRKHFRG